MATQGEVTEATYPPEQFDDDDDSDLDVGELESYTPPKPYLMKFQQQRLPTFYLAPTVNFTLGALTVSWIVCGLLAAVYLSENKTFTEKTIRYDNVGEYRFPSDDAQSDPSLLKTFTYTTASGNVTSSQGRRSTISFTLEETIPAPVTMYYVLDPFYQNFRSFAEGGDDTQLLGELVEKDSLFACIPLRTPGEYYPRGQEVTGTAISADGKQQTLSDFVYSPCGVKAWSLFNDSVVLEQIRTDGGSGLVCNTSDFDAFGNRLTLSESQNLCRKKGIIWDIDYERFKAAATGPLIWSRNYGYDTDNTFLRNGWYFNEAGHSLPDPQDEDLISWLAISPTASTQKVWRIIDIPLESHDLNGNVIEYRMTIDEFFPVTPFGAEKRIHFLGGTGSIWLQAPNRRIVIPLLVTSGFAFLVFWIILIGCCIARRKSSQYQGTLPDKNCQDLNSLMAGYKQTPSLTLEESLRPDSYESGQYVWLTAQRAMDWDRQKRDAKGFKEYQKAKEREAAALASEVAPLPKSASHAQ